ncbi:hypothetical protein VHUM_02295 [Vanrija humicola]|uniref:amidase n=1 Tax=Vanrija humicola TaxID=5417 RepID=A0A7D8V0J0_VANHU|nr:hypothetical protein VHUM_02295 [Vanrija humicola]
MTSTEHSSTDWASRAAAKRAARDALLPADTLLPAGLVPESQTDVTAVPRTCGLLSAHELEITDADVPAILAKLAAGEWTSEEVTRAFSRRASIAHQLTNCLTEVFFERGIAHAKELDEELKRTGKPRGPLHGLPVSLKEQIGVEGVERSFGFVGFLGRVAEVDSALVEILVAQGAVPYCATNIAQGLFFGEAVNNVFGETVNPYNRKLTPGGSSGGEGALLALRGSPLGVGSDIGGSVRIPAGHCGLYSLRPSYQRIPYEGTCNSQEGQDSIRSVLGPLSTSLGGVKALFKAVLDAEPWRLDPQVLRQGWSAERYALAEHGDGKRLVFGMMWDDGVVRPVPPYTRAMAETKAALEGAGHKVVDFVPFEADEGKQIFVRPVPRRVLANPSSRPLGATAWYVPRSWLTRSRPPARPVRHARARGRAPRRAVQGRPARPRAQHHPVVGAACAQRQIPQGPAGRVERDGGGNGERPAGRRGHLPRCGRAGAGAPHAAVSSGRPCHSRQLLARCAGSPSRYHTYTHWCNVADFPTAAIPVTRVDPALDPKVARDDFHGAEDKFFWEQCASSRHLPSRALTSPDDPAVYANSPIGLQVVGLKGEDEAVLAWVRCDNLR